MKMNVPFSVTLPDQVRFWSRWQPDRCAVQTPSDRMTWRELDRRSDALCGALQGLGVVRGSVVGILMANDLPFIECTIAVLKLGAAVAPLNPRYTSRELAATASDARFSAILTDERSREVLESADTDCVVVQFCALQRSAATQCRQIDAPVCADDIAIVGYTSGTTGKPKGVMLSHTNIVAAGFQRLPCEGQCVGTKVLLPTPLGYTGGLVVTFLELTVLSGATLVLLPEFDVDACLDAIERYRINYLNVASPIIERMAQSARFAGTDLASLRSVCIGGTTVSLETLELWHARSVRVSQSYGQTETAGGATFLPPDAAVRKMHTAGIAHMFTQLRINGALQPGDIGEILIRGPAVMTGYFGKVSETAAAIRDGWLHTGDLGSLDCDDFLTIVGRLHQMIISGGLNVYPAEIEAVMNRLKGIRELVVIGVPDERWGEVPMLIVACDSPEEVKAEEIRAIARTELADYKRPKYVVRLTDALPRNSAGKIAVTELRNRYQSVPADAQPLK